MTRSDEAEWWFNAVYEAVQEIPRGHVTSYGHIARLLGKRKWLLPWIFLFQLDSWRLWLMLTFLVQHNVLGQYDLFTQKGMLPAN